MSNGSPRTSICDRAPERASDQTDGNVHQESSTDPWNEIRSELAQRFDTRTTAGRHILYDHLLPLVEGRWFCLAEYVVDSAGILKSKPRARRRRKYERPFEPSAEEQAWMAARRVGLRGSAYFWFVQTDSGAFRQGRRLTPADIARFLPCRRATAIDATLSPTPPCPAPVDHGPGGELPTSRQARLRTDAPPHLRAGRG